MAEVYGKDYIDKIGEWVKRAKQLIGLDDEVIFLNPMRFLNPTPEEMDDIPINTLHEQDILVALSDENIHEAKIKHDKIRSDLERLEYLTIDQRLRYSCSRRASIMACSNNLERISRDTELEFGRP